MELGTGADAMMTEIRARTAPCSTPSSSVCRRRQAGAGLSREMSARSVAVATVSPAGPEASTRQRRRAAHPARRDRSLGRLDAGSAAAAC